MRGSVSAEHGIGKIKASLLETMFGPDGIAAMRQVKAIFDPEGLLNPGNLFFPFVKHPPAQVLTDVDEHGAECRCNRRGEAGDSGCLGDQTATPERV